MNSNKYLSPKFPCDYFPSPNPSLEVEIVIKPITNFGVNLLLPCDIFDEPLFSLCYSPFQLLNNGQVIPPECESWIPGVPGP